MTKQATPSKEIIIGLVAASIPFFALAYKFGFKKTAAIFIIIIVTFLFAKIAIYLFGRRSNLTKSAAIAMQGNLIFLFFLPKTLKQQISELKHNEKTPSNTTTHQDD